MTTIHRIADRAQEFPCWGWNADPRFVEGWDYYTREAWDRIPGADRAFRTHWSPDAPTAPTERPEPHPGLDADHAGNQSGCFAATPPPAPAGTPASGADLIAAERDRQVSVEGWSAAHDNEHDQGEIARAARAAGGEGKASIDTPAKG